MTFDEMVVDDELLDYVISTKDSVVCVNFYSEYATVVPSDTCIHVNGNALKQSLDCFSLLKYKSVCIHRKRLLVTVSNSENHFC